MNFICKFIGYSVAGLWILACSNSLKAHFSDLVCCPAWLCACSQVMRLFWAAWFLNFSFWQVKRIYNRFVDAEENGQFKFLYKKMGRFSFHRRKWVIQFSPSPARSSSPYPLACSSLLPSFSPTLWLLLRVAGCKFRKYLEARWKPCLMLHQLLLW